MHKPTASDADSIRLNRFLAQLGVASRRACDSLIAAGRVRVDGRVVREPGTRVNPGESSIEFDGARLGRPPKRVVLILNKPKGFVSTVTDPEGRPTVLDLCGPLGKRQRLFPVGRLDVNTTGALLMTNDGFLCFRLTHPRFGIARVYQVRVRGQLDEARVRRLEKMAASEARVARKTKPEPGRRQAPKPQPAVEVVARLEKEAVMRVTLLEGRNRQVRRMCEAVGLRVVALKRLSFGSISVRKMPVGAVRELTTRELSRLDQATGGSGRGH
ncbi:MAG: rRNA pseudouridine synthase [Candidatus Krumholzibacteria bacterium]|nr:rRNA pseudouridine synthase [Candidatus Krumholzibacteria bacterium]MDH4337159.1 rRNA pseudouridine synthase [Candidatus Krumholzibacteria bacterium]MDH5269123.1 rRNA pseudouridine synthase [Candidatus Krumholzibacteria bacterium]MDH5626818.1 rRNA pseudouridine synthase [Candidatus Krumholzibacteria bacterium]